MDQDIKKALLKLDISNDAHWTSDGLPRVEALSIDGLTRGKMMKAAPYFTRSRPSFEPPVKDDPELIDEDNPTSAGTHEQPQRETTLNFESTEFGGSAPIERNLPPRPTTPQLQLEAEQLRKKLAVVTEERSRLSHEEMQLSRRLDELHRQMGEPVGSSENQQRIMNYLAHAAGTPQVAQVDRAFQPQRDPTQQRPMRTPRDVSQQ